MRIVRVDLHRVRLPLRHGFRTSSHGKDFLEHILVRAEDADGAVGWGECACGSDPFYGPENVDTCWLMLRDYLVPALLGVEWDDPDQAYATGNRVRGNLFARAGLDLACRDLAARVEGVSLASALGATEPFVTAGVSLGIEADIATLLDQIEGFLAEGYARIKLKIAPGWDVAPVAATRERFGDIALMVDANGAYGPADLDHLRGLDTFGLQMIEQPFAPRDFVLHARLQEQVSTPVCLDESIESLGDLDTALRLGAARIVNIKVSRLGGLGPARAVHDRCLAEGIPVWCGGMHEFGVGRAANVALGALPGFTLPSDTSGSDKYYVDDVIDPPIRAVRGQVAVPYERPGIGHEIRPDVLAAHLVRTETRTAG